MVNVGGPSKGCLTCIRRKIRVCLFNNTCVREKHAEIVQCNRARPSCLQCQKGNRQCDGYRDETDLMFRHQSQKVIARVHQDSQSQPTASTSRSTTLKWPSSEVANVSISRSGASESEAPTVNRSPKLGQDSGLVDFFANNFTCSDSVEMRSNLFWIPRNFDDFLKDKTAKLSVQCAGAMALARLQRSPYYLREAQKTYSVAALSLADLW